MRTLISMICALLLSVTASIAQTAETLHAIQPTNRPVSIAKAVGGALRFLKDKQEQDGSWGRGQQSYSATALALSAFLRTGETKASIGFGETIANAHKWLLAARPESSDDRLAVVVALSDYSTVHADTSTAQRVTSLVKAFEDPKDSTWADILCTTRLPEETTRPTWCLSPKQVHQKYLKTTDILPDTKDQYMGLYLTSRTMFNSNAKARSIHYQYLADTVLKRQLADGSFPASVQEDKVAATALVILSLSDLYQFAPRFAPPPTGSTPHEEKPCDVDVNIKIR